MNGGLMYLKPSYTQEPSFCFIFILKSTLAEICTDSSSHSTNDTNTQL